MFQRCVFKDMSLITVIIPPKKKCFNFFCYFFPSFFTKGENIFHFGSFSTGGVINYTFPRHRQKCDKNMTMKANYTVLYWRNFFFYYCTTNLCIDHIISIGESLRKASNRKMIPPMFVVSTFVSSWSHFESCTAN